MLTKTYVHKYIIQNFDGSNIEIWLDPELTVFNYSQKNIRTN